MAVSPTPLAPGPGMRLRQATPLQTGQALQESPRHCRAWFSTSVYVISILLDSIRGGRNRPLSQLHDTPAGPPRQDADGQKSFQKRLDKYRLFRYYSGALHESRQTKQNQDGKMAELV